MIDREDIEKWIAVTNPDVANALVSETSANDILSLLWPLIDAYQKRQLTPGRGLFADEIALFNELKEKLGLPPMDSW